MDKLPVAVIGAGPLGLAAAAHLLERGQDVMVLEAGAGPADAVRDWGHVRLFSPWPELVDAAADRMLRPLGWTAPASGYPTGAEWVSRYLDPLAAALGDHVRYGMQVTGVSRRGRDRLVTAGRAKQPFTIHLAGADGGESRVEARAVIDASGTWRQPNPAGADGLPAAGERSAAAAGLLTYLPPTSAQAAEWAGQHIAVVGSGHSAMTAILGLARMAKAHPGTQITWVLRRGINSSTFGGGTADDLPQRGALGTRTQAAVQAGLVELVAGFRTQETRLDGGQVMLSSENGRSLPGADHVVVLTGFRPDLSFLTEMRLALDPILQAPAALAPEIDPNVHSCGTVMPHGARELAHPEPGLYLVGMKSYGRAPTFLAMTGYEQVRSVAAELAGDHEAASRVELALPDTGVCTGSGLPDSPRQSDSPSGCCEPAPAMAPAGPGSARA